MNNDSNIPSEAPPAEQGEIDDLAAAPAKPKIPKLGERPPEPESTGPTAMRFTVRFLLFVMLVSAGYAIWVGYRWRRTNEQMRIVEPLKKYGAQVNLWKGHVTRVTLRLRDDQTLDPSVLAPLSKLPKLTRLVLIDTGGDARMIEHVGKVKSLEELLIINANLGQADLAPLVQLSSLNTLWLCDANLNDETLDPLGEMATLRRLNLNDNQLTDNGLLRLAPLVDLEQLHMANNAITDNGVNLVKQTMLNAKIIREPIPGYQP